MRLKFENFELPG